MIFRRVNSISQLDRVSNNVQRDLVAAGISFELQQYVGSFLFFCTLAY